jgi:hypothetical protein
LEKLGFDQPKFYLISIKNLTVLDSSTI